MIITGRTSVADTAVQLDAGEGVDATIRSARKWSLIVRNTSASVTLDIGPSTIASGEGWELRPGEWRTWDSERPGAIGIHAIAAAGLSAAVQWELVITA